MEGTSATASENALGAAGASCPSFPVSPWFSLLAHSQFRTRAAGSPAAVLWDLRGSDPEI